MTKINSKEDLSIKLTKISLIILFLASLGLLSTGRQIVNLVIEYPSILFEEQLRFWIMLASGYILGLIALSCIVHLYKLLTRIGENQVFIPENVQYLRYLGWEVGAVALISLFLGLTVYLPMLLIAVSCSLLTLIIRVIRNAFGKAVELQEDVDYTI